MNRTAWAVGESGRVRPAWSLSPASRQHAEVRTWGRAGLDVGQRQEAPIAVQEWGEKYKTMPKTYTLSEYQGKTPNTRLL